MTGDAQPSLGHFATQLYQQQGVADALLAMQDEDGLNIPLLLFILWCGYHQGELSTEELANARVRADNLVAGLVQPLRQARRWLKTHLTDSQQLYGQLLDAELACEFCLLATLEREFSTCASVGTNGRHQALANAEAYLAQAGIPLTLDNEKRLAVVYRHLPA